jgi:hypothetical protein
MSYPVMNSDSIARFVEVLAASGGRPTQKQLDAFWADHCAENASPYQVDIRSITALVREIEEALRTEHTPRAAEMLEGRFAGRLHEVLVECPIEVLDDHEFWTYLAVVHFWRFILVREQKSFEAASKGSRAALDDDSSPSEEHVPFRRYFDGTDVYQIPLRMFIRAQAVESDGDYSLTEAVSDGTDFWRSHVIRVSTSYWPPLSRALVRRQADERLGTTELRKAAKTLNRYRANMYPAAYDDDLAEQAVDRSWRSV